MKKLIAVAMAIAIIAMAGVAMAANDTANVTVTASVVGTCKFTSGGTLAIGELPFNADGTSAGKTYAQVEDLVITYWCTKGAVYGLSDPAGSFKNASVERSRSLTLGTDTIAYTLKITDQGRALTEPRATLTNITLDAMVAAAAYNDYTAGTYTDSVTLTLTP